MATSFRHVRGEVNSISLPAYSSDQVEAGDLLFWDATNDAVRPAGQVSGADYATKKGNLASAFVGVAMESKDAGTSGNILVATSGDFLMDAPTGAGSDAEPLDYVAGGDGTNMLDQTVNKTSTASEAIGRVLAQKSTSQAYAMIRLLSKLNLG